MCNVKINYFVLCHIAISAHKVHIGQQFHSFLAFESFKERYQNTEYVQFCRRDSRTVETSAARCLKKTLNPAIKFYETTYHCVRGGKKHKPTGTGKKETRYAYLSIYSLVGSYIQLFVHFSFISCIRSFNLLLIHSFILARSEKDRPFYVFSDAYNQPNIPNFHFFNYFHLNKTLRIRLSAFTTYIGKQMWMCEQLFPWCLRTIFKLMRAKVVPVNDTKCMPSCKK